jgi:copper chaperone NosL
VSRRALGSLAAILLLAALGACGRSEGPHPIAWDREACTHCHMLIGDPAFAAQLETADGETPAFDDPGCLLAYLAERRPRVSAMFFHHLREDRWIPGDRVAFVQVARSPMGYGLGAVDAGTPGSFSLERAEALVVARDAAREGRR